jgi:hypothetical protein
MSISIVAISFGGNDPPPPAARPGAQQIRSLAQNNNRPISWLDPEGRPPIHLPGPPIRGENP